MAKPLSAASKTALFQAHEVSYALTEALLAVMACKGVSRAAVARELGVSPASLKPVFDATPTLNIRKLLEVCQALDVDAWALLEAVGRRRESVAAPWSQTDLTALAASPKKRAR